MNHLDKLLSVASHPFSTGKPSILATPRLADFPELLEMLRVCNGFTAFESALVVFPTTEAEGVPDIFEWNAADGWRRTYLDVLSSGYFCFAHDLFGVQFAVSSEGVIRLDPESGKVTSYAGSIVEWAERLLENFEEDTAWPLAHDWQSLHRGLQPYERLLPKQPFVLGGDYIVENMVSVDCKPAMEYWGKLYNAIRSVPDGGRVSLSGWIV
jgi:hypothetical protein